MSKPPEKLHHSDKQLFSEEVSDIKPLTQDKITPSPDKNRLFVNQNVNKINPSEKDYDDEHRYRVDNLSDEYDPFENEQQRNDLNYHHHSVSKRQFISLKKGQHRSELILDLHGFNRQQARNELVDFFQYCHNHNYRYVSIMPGQGMGILRQSLNSWLRQIPEVLAFAESPQRSGGKGYIRILLSK